MDFDLSEDQQLLRKTVSDFRKSRSDIERFRKLRDDAAGRGWSPELWAEMGELGWLGVCFPEEAGGLGQGFLEAALILEELGKNLVPEPFLASVILGGYALSLAGDEGQHERFLAPALEGETSLALAWAEAHSRFDPTRVACEARACAGGFTLHGDKRFVLNAHAADTIVVSANTPDGLALFALPSDAEGLARTPFQMIDGHRAAHLKLEGVKVGADQQLKARPAAEVLARTLDYGAAASVAEGLGVAARMLEMTTEYLDTREQFGRKIGSFQALQHRAVDMFIEVELLRSLSIEVMIRADEGGAGDEDEDGERQAAISAAKVQLGRGGQFVSRQAVQLHGGIGVTDEADIGLYFKRMQALSAICGDAMFHAQRYAGRRDASAA
ncbi:acyl-CoA dehydrogenase family protein [Pseudenhygromyxa sp. WMMC2535]|uniref:acyl-CoA dehydrogenase family protein n=1 Tax=Pseudenhygromyxa sp. WMMC2535 TaxID=2712867 RepID=UPI00155166B1|nr:acyl-CoA dehydrogenase family protein [Pseudenhygromyxa sp. WMMC2535]NVB39656.1 acyl-CoA dehydrogenase family protein [Pseudenhygromyxa sp. WMMC2535]